MLGRETCSIRYSEVGCVYRWGWIGFEKATIFRGCCSTLAYSVHLRSRILAQLLLLALLLLKIQRLQ